MDKNEKLHGNWEQLKSQVQEKWTKLTEQDLQEIAGKAEVLIDKITERYNITKAEAKEKLHAFLEEASAQTKVKVQQSEDYIKKNPFKAVGIGLAVGALLGMLFKSKKK